MLLSVVSDEAASAVGVEAAVEVGTGQQVTADLVIISNLLLRFYLKYSNTHSVTLYSMLCNP